MRAGAHDFLLKPLKPAFLASTLARLAEHWTPHPAADARPEPATPGRLGEMVGRSPAMREVFRLIARVAGSEAPVMITGESGTGKEVAARTVHALSRRARGPFVAVNCGAISPHLVESELFGHEKGSFTGAERRRAGTFEMAHGGTLFLDEVTEMPPDLQVKFLRVLDTRAFRRVGGNEELDVDVRLVASSNRDLAEAVKNGSFRSDLFYRLNVFPLWMPPLRLRKEDIPALASHFLSQVEEKEGRGFTALSDGALDVLGRHDWPGNVRELKNAVHRAYVLSDPPAVPPEVVEAVLGAPHAAEPAPAARCERGRVALGAGARRRAAGRRRAQAPARHPAGRERRSAGGGGDPRHQPEDRLQPSQGIRPRSRRASRRTASRLLSATGLAR